jgi:hypothetical protein
LATSFALSIGTTALLLLYWIVMVAGAGADGIGWLLATTVYTVLLAYLGGAVVGAAALVMAGIVWSRSKDRRAALGVGFAVVSLGLWVWLKMGGPVPRGPLG